MGIVGNLETMSISDLLQFLENGMKSGILKVSQEKINKEIFFEKGLIIGSTSNDPKEYFGQFLLHYGKIDEFQLKSALEKQRKSKVLLGHIFVSMGLMSESEMMDLLQRRALEIIYEVFLWEQAEFEFHDKAPLPEDLIRIEIRPTTVTMEGMYRVDEWRRYRELIPSDRVVLGLAPGHTMKHMEPGSEIPKILGYVKKQMTVGEISYNLHASPFHVYSELYHLINDNVLRVVEELAAVQSPETSIPRPEETTNELLQRVSQLLKKDSTELGQIVRGGYGINFSAFDEAFTLLQRVLEAEPNQPEARALLSAAESHYARQIYGSVLKPQAVPLLVVSLDSLPTIGLGPKEGFILSRINGSWDVKSILSICPFREAEGLRILKKLCDAGLVRF